jgi:hypothetical protein
LNEAYAAYAETANPWPAEALRFAFGLATTLVHETGHAFYAKNFYDENENYNELYPCIGHHNEGKKGGELGFALEHALSKGFHMSTIHPVNGVEIEWKSIVSIVDNCTLVSVRSCLVFPLQTAWPAKFASQTFWDRCV